MLDGLAQARHVRAFVLEAGRHQNPRRRDVAPLDHDAEAVAVAPEVGDGAAPQLGAVLGRLLGQHAQQVAPRDALGEARIVVAGRYFQRSAVAGIDHQRLAAKATEINCRSQASRSAADDDTVKPHAEKTQLKTLNSFR